MFDGKRNGFNSEVIKVVRIVSFDKDNGMGQFHVEVFAHSNNCEQIFEVKVVNFSCTAGKISLEFMWFFDKVDAESRSGSMFQEHILGACALVLCEPMNVGTGGTEWSASVEAMMK